MRELLAVMCKTAGDELRSHVKPRDDFERDVVNAIGEISWDEAIVAIMKHRSALSEP